MSKKDDIENWYLDEGEYVWYEKDSIDGYLEDIENGEVLEVQCKEYVVINSNPVFATNVFTDSDNIEWELFDSKEEAEKAAAHCKAMIEAAQENSHEDNACTKYDWSNVPNEVNVITTNKFGKKEYWWMWRGALPKLGHSGWYDEYCGRCIDSFSISEFVGDWKESLEVRPKMTLKKSDGDRHE